MNKQLAPRTLQVVGLVLLVASFAYAIVSGKPSTEFTSAAMALISLGTVWAQQQGLPKEPPKPEYEQPRVVLKPPSEEPKDGQ